jgi:hypothetical protein
MDLTRAVRIVALDQTETDDISSVADAIAHVMNVLRLPEEPAVPGSYPIEEDGSELAAAYRLVLEHSHYPAQDIASVAGEDFAAEYALARKTHISHEDWARFNRWLDGADNA